MPPATIRRMRRPCSTSRLRFCCRRICYRKALRASASAGELFLRREIVLNKELQDLIDVPVAAEAERLGARRCEHPRPAADNRLDCWIELPADAGMGCLAAGAAQRGCH